MVFLFNDKQQGEFNGQPGPNVVPGRKRRQGRKSRKLSSELLSCSECKEEAASGLRTKRANVEAMTEAFLVSSN